MDINDIVDILQKDIVNERINTKIVCLVVIGGRLCTNKDPLSLNLLLNDEGGIGKDFLVSTIMDTVSTKDWLLSKAPTPAAITLTQLPGKDGKVIDPIDEMTIIYLEDAPPSFTDGENSHLKLLTDGDVKDYKVVYNMKTYYVSWKKPVVLITSAEASLNEQGKRRIPQLSLDASPEQTRAIVKRIGDIAAGKHQGITKQDRIKINKFVTSLKPVSVNIPETIVAMVNSQFLKGNEDKIFLRTLISRIYDYIRFSAVIQQRNRKNVDKDTIIATEEDFHVMKEIINVTYKADEISDNTLSQFNQRQKDIIKTLRETEEWYTVNQIRHWKNHPKISDVSEQTIYGDIRAIVQRVKDINMYNSGRGASYANQYGHGDKPPEDDEKIDSKGISNLVKMTGKKYEESKKEGVIKK
jgi:hypothetical protein